MKNRASNKIQKTNETGKQGLVIRLAGSHQNNGLFNKMALCLLFIITD